jgi:hypothetical protein
MSQSTKVRSSVEANLIRKAWSDKSFQSELLANPTATYSAEMTSSGGALAADTEVRAVVEDAKTLYLVIPNVEVDASTEVKLSERSSRSDFEAALILRAMRDAEFKKELKADPKAAYEAQLASVRQGAKLPENMSVSVLEETGKVLYFRLPQAPAQGGELSEEDLAEVAGGIVAVGVAIASTVAVGAVAAAVLLVADEPIERTMN